MSAIQHASPKTSDTVVRSASLGPDVLASFADPRAADGLESLGEILDQFGALRPLLICSREAIKTSGLDGVVDATLAGRLVRTFADFTPNPTIEECVLAARAAAEHRADVVIAIGGGTAIDIAKLAAAAAADPSGLPTHAVEGRFGQQPALPIIAVPSTAGTGAEATHFAAVYFDGVKRSVAHPSLRPSFVVLDVRLHLCMPAPLAAVTGLDALAQSMESLWAVSGTEASQALARHACSLVAPALAASVRDGSPTARRDMMLGAHLAGRAIDVSKTTLSHALSYALTRRYGIPHGHAVALTLGAVAEANAAVCEDDCLDPRGPHSVAARVHEATGFISATPDTALAGMRRLLSRLHVATRLAEAGVPRADLKFLARAVDPVRMSNNPRRFDKAGIMAVLERAWAG